MNKVDTIDFKGNDYALVPDRLKAFREANPRASIETAPTLQPDGTIIFKASIVADQADENSPKATGHALGKNDSAKAFERLETVAVGRALANLGYLNNGQIATSEEMLEFEEHKNELILSEIAEATDRAQFAEILAKLTPAQKQLATPFIKQRIEELKSAAAN